MFHKSLNQTLKVKEYGYRKLKEFLMSFPEIELNDKGFAQIKQKPVLEKDDLIELISEIIKEKDYGVTESVLEAILQQRTNISIDWTIYNVSSCEEFIRQHSKSSIQILRTPEYNILFKANELKTYSYFFPFKGYFNSAVLESSRVPSPTVYHSVSYSVDLNPGICRNSYVPMQRIINVSNVPSDMIHKSPFRDSEFDEDRYPEPFFLIEDLSNVTGSKSPGSRSIQISKHSSTFEWHSRTHSVYLPETIQHSHINYSWTENKPLGLDKNLH